MVLNAFKLDQLELRKEVEGAKCFNSVKGLPNLRNSFKWLYERETYFRNCVKMAIFSEKITKIALG